MCYEFRMTDEAKDANAEEERQWNHDITRAIVGGIVTITMGVGTAVLLGQVSGFEARKLVESLIAVLPYLASAGIASASTILALMITLLGIGRDSKRKFTKIFYRRILWSGRQASMIFLSSLIMLLLMAAPVAGATQTHAGILTQLQFYLTAGLTAINTGLFVSLISMLQSTLADLVNVIGLGVESNRLVRNVEE